MPFSDQPPLDRAAAAFRAHFARDPRLSAAAPGRVNLIGEHTDYNDGFVLPIAIDRRTVVCIDWSRTATTRVHAADLNTSAEFPDLKSLRAAPDLTLDIDNNRVRAGSWASYVGGVLSNLAAIAPALASRGVELSIASSVPLGSGLSSSASLEVGVAAAAAALAGVSIPPRDLAILCRDAEHRFAGVPCGIMDQFIAAMGQPDHALLIDCRTQAAELVAMPGADRAVVVVMDSRVKHSLASGQYAQRRDTCRAACRVMGIESLREATPELLARFAPDAGSSGGLSTIEHARARHIVSENARTLAAAAAFRAGDLAEVGRLMLASHASLRDDYQVSCPELDALVELASRVPGVFGARMTGGGFGGCAIALATPDAAAHLVRDIPAAYRVRLALAANPVANSGANLDARVFITSAQGGAAVLA
ncbi:MAG: galactokinase [Phycisphaerae bacterium]|nr:galactokinase [Phycisphaerae bacterium]